jgi:hypothetical protein
LVAVRVQAVAVQVFGQQGADVAVVVDDEDVSICIHGSHYAELVRRCRADLYRVFTRSRAEIKRYLGGPRIYKTIQMTPQRKNR